MRSLRRVDGEVVVCREEEVERNLVELLNRVCPGRVRWARMARRWKAPENLVGKLGEMQLLVNHR